MATIDIPIEVASTPDGGRLIFETEPDYRGFYDEHFNKVSSLALAQCGALHDATKYVKANWPECHRERSKT